MTRELKLAAVALIYQDKLFSETILGVSRKNNSSDFGLPGGKIEFEETLYDGLCREVFEETGLIIKKARPIFVREDGEFIATVFLVEEWEGQISTQESGVVDWINFEELKRGTFGEYNSKLEEQINFIRCLAK
jgi:8-oxo-dGTP pyrophosphatase MutT (NUDIX family)